MFDVPNTPIETAKRTAAEVTIRPTVATLPPIAARSARPSNLASRTRLSRNTP